VDSGGPKEAQVQSYSPGGANVPSWEGTWRNLANTIEPSVCGGDAALMSNYFDHLLESLRLGFETVCRQTSSSDS